VLNSSYDTGVCSCDEQMSVFDTCVSEYPCLKVYVSYFVVITPITASPSPSSRNSSSLDEHDRRRRSAAAEPVDDVGNWSTSAGGQLAEAVVDAPAHQLSRFNVSLDDDGDAPASTASSRHSSRRDRVAAGNGSGPMTSHTAATDCDFTDLTPTTYDVNRSYVAKLYRSWDDSFLPQV